MVVLRSANDGTELTSRSLHFMVERATVYQARSEIRHSPYRSIRDLLTSGYIPPMSLAPKLSTNGTAVPHPCAFQTADGYDASTSSTYRPTNPPVNYNQTFAAGAALGTVGLEKISIGGLTVQGQQFAIVDSAAPILGDYGTVDGLFGLAWPEVGKFYTGSDSSLDSPQTLEPYSPWLFSAVNQSVIEPYFSLVLDRPARELEANLTDIPRAGVLTLGGVSPDAPGSNTSVTVPNVGVPSLLEEDRRDIGVHRSTHSLVPDATQSHFKIARWNMHCSIVEHCQPCCQCPWRKHGMPRSLLLASWSTARSPCLLQRQCHGTARKHNIRNQFHGKGNQFYLCARTICRLARRRVRLGHPARQP